MKNIKSKKLYFKVFEEIKSYIVSHNLQPGDRLPTEMEMAELLGVSRNVLREAIKTLEIIGVVTSKPGVGMIVNSFNSNFLSSCMFLNLIGDNKELVGQSQEVRTVMELGFAKKSFDSMIKEDIDTLQKLVDDMNFSETLNGDYYLLDIEFHRTMYKRLQNHVLSAFVDSAWECERYYKSMFAQNKEINIDKHQRIVDALVAKDYSKYLEALEYHFNCNYKAKI